MNNRCLGCYRSVEEIGKRTIDAINNLKDYKLKSTKNQQIIWELSSWEKNIQNWIMLYKKLIS